MIFLVTLITIKKDLHLYMWLNFVSRVKDLILIDTV